MCDRRTEVRVIFDFNYDKVHGALVGPAHIPIGQDAIGY